MKAMILAAGRGERLKPLTDTTPKPLLEIDGEPLIAHQLRWLVGAGVRQVVVNLHHLGPQIEAALGDGHRFGVSIRYSREDTLLETGGGIAKALPILGDAPFLLLNGDIWTDFSFAALPTHLNGDLAHLVLVDKPAHREVGDFDLVGGRVRRSGGRAMVYCGIALLTPGLFAGAADGPFSLRDLLFAAADRDRIGGQGYSGLWIDIGSPERLAAARAAAARHSAG